MKTLRLVKIAVVVSTILAGSHNIYAGVNADGSYSYALPIDVPAGINGMNPNLALSYNSNAGNGIVGKGWNLSGIPTITYDPKAENSLGTNISPYVGPGGRLVYEGTTVGNFQYKEHNLSTLTLATDSQTCSYSDANCYWVEKLPDGSKRFYGETANSRYGGADTTSTPIIWALSRVIDKHGNGYQIKYQEGTNEIYPEEILYTTHADLTHYRRIFFEYETRTDIRRAYRKGLEVRTNLRLASVHVETNVTCLFSCSGDLVRRYDLSYEYETTTGQSRLISVQEFGSDGVTSLPATTFAYEAGGNDFVAESLTLPVSQKIYWPSDNTKYYQTGDFVDVNGDGLLDFVESYSDTSGVDHRQVYINTGSGWTTSTTYKVPYTLRKYWADGSGMFTQTGELVDLNGDGLVDWLISYYSLRVGYERIVYLNNGTTWNSNETFFDNCQFPAGASYRFYQESDSLVRQFGDVIDVNRDGLLDLIFSTQSTSGSFYKKACINNGANFSSSTEYEPLYQYRIQKDTATGTLDFVTGQYVDFDGNGYIDQIVSYHDGGITKKVTYNNNGNGWLPKVYNMEVLLEKYINTYDSYGQPIQWTTGDFIDYNGDGLVDFIQSHQIPDGASGTLDRRQAYVNNGVNLFYDSAYPVTWSRYVYSGADMVQEPLTGQYVDINADGLTDYYVSYIDENGNLVQNVQLNNGSGWTSATINNGPVINDIQSGVSGTGQFIDIDGDGVSDYVESYEKDGVTHSTVYRNLHKNEKLNLVVNQMGGRIAIDYTPALQFVNSDGSRPVEPLAESYPVVTNSSPRDLVSSVSAYGGAIVDGVEEPPSVSLYEYTNGLNLSGNLLDRKSLGFKSRRVIEDNGSYAKYTYYHNEDFRLAGILKEVNEYSEPIGGVPGSEVRLAKSLYIYETVDSPTVADSYVVRPRSDLAPGTLQYYAEYKAKYDIDTGAFLDRTFTRVEYDSSHPMGVLNPSVKRVRTVGMSDVVNVYQYNYDDTAGVYGELSWETTKRLGIVKNKTSYTYDAQHNLIKESKLLVETGTYLDTEYTYNVHGQAISKTDPPYGSTGSRLTTLYEYDPDFSIFLTKITQDSTGLNLSSSFTYDTVSGKIVVMTEPSGSSLENVYDVFGRLIMVNNDNGAWIKKVFYNAFGNPDGQHVFTLMNIFEPGMGNQWDKKYYNGFGRLQKEIRNAHLGDQWENTIQEFKYGANGRLVRESLPYFDGDTGVTPIYYKYYSYDEAGRPTVISHPDGTQESFNYVGNSVEKTDKNGHVYINEYSYNTTGQLIVNKEPDTDGGGAAVMTKQYDELGRLVSVVDPDLNTTTYGYNSLNQLVSMVEPNSGSWSYSYYPNGNLQNILAPDGKTNSYVYDATNRMTVKDLDGVDHDVYYYYDKKADGTTTPNGVGKLNEVVDASGRTLYTYDNLGNLSAWTKYINNYNGQQTAAAFTFSATYDPMGRIKQLTYPDGESIKNYYSNRGYLRQVRLFSSGQTGGHPIVTYGAALDGTNRVKRVTGSEVSGNQVETLLEYNPTNMRVNSVKTTLANGTLGQHQQFNYDNNGNITRIDDLLNWRRTTTFTYDARNRIATAQADMYKPFTADNTGNLAYQFSKGGNVQVKGDFTFNYGTNCAVAGSSQGVCEKYDANSNLVATYEYDANGNMTLREGRNFVYDPENRLISINENGVNKLNFVYDHNGQRVMKQRQDGTTVYSIDGLYEVSVGPSGEFHTKYVYGEKGDLAAQITRDGTSVTVAAINKISDVQMASFYDTASLKSAWLLAGHWLNQRFSTVHTRADLYLYLFAVLALLLVYFKVRFRTGSVMRKEEGQGDTRTLMGPSALLTLMVFLNAFVFNGCWVNNDGAVDPLGYVSSDWTDPALPQVADSTLATYNDTANHGQPLLGTFFVHPNHQGSVSLVTDSSGQNIVSRLNYTPYGEIVRENTASTTIAEGPDIVRAGFTGQEKDIETSLSYYNARYYDPDIGRFITMDAKADMAAGVQALNRYMYTSGNPVNSMDPTGHSRVGDWWRGVVSTASTVVDDCTPDLDIDIIGWAQNTWDNIKEGFSNARDAINHGIDRAQERWNNFIDKAGKVYDKITGDVTETFQRAKDDIGKVAGKLSTLVGGKWLAEIGFKKAAKKVAEALGNVFSGSGFFAGVYLFMAVGALIGAAIGGAIGGVVGLYSWANGGHWTDVYRYSLIGATQGAAIGGIIGGFVGSALACSVVGPVCAIGMVVVLLFIPDTKKTVRKITNGINSTFDDYQNFFVNEL